MDQLESSQNKNVDRIKFFQTRKNSGETKIQTN